MKNGTNFFRQFKMEGLFAVSFFGQYSMAIGMEVGLDGKVNFIKY